MPASIPGCVVVRQHILRLLAILQVSYLPSIAYFEDGDRENCMNRYSNDITIGRSCASQKATRIADFHMRFHGAASRTLSVKHSIQVCWLCARVVCAMVVWHDPEEKGYL